MILLDILVGKVGDSLLDGWTVVFMYEKLDSWKTRLSDCIPELILFHRKGKLSGSMFWIPDSRRNMVLGRFRGRCGRYFMESREGWWYHYELIFECLGFLDSCVSYNLDFFRWCFSAEFSVDFRLLDFGFFVLLWNYFMNGIHSSMLAED